MRTRVEVLTVEAINARLRELESQQAASGPVASVSEIESLLNDAVGHAMDYARGDNHATNKHEASWNEALTRIRALAKPHPSEAAVRVTDAMVRSAFVRLYPGCEPDEMQYYHAADIRAALKAALDAAEGTPGA